jgi:hypothetical protein
MKISPVNIPTRLRCRALSAIGPSHQQILPPSETVASNWLYGRLYLDPTKIDIDDWIVFITWCLKRNWPQFYHVGGDQGTSNKVPTWRYLVKCSAVRRRPTELILTGKVTWEPRDDQNEVHFAVLQRWRIEGIQVESRTRSDSEGAPGLGISRVRKIKVVLSWSQPIRITSPYALVLRFLAIFIFDVHSTKYK